MDRRNLSDRGKAIETKIAGKAKKDFLRQMCERYHLDLAIDHLPYTSSQIEARKEVPSLPDDQPHQALLSRNNEKILFAKIQIVETKDRGNSIFADETIKKGNSIFPFMGDVIPLDEASYKSLQINDDFCVESADGYGSYLNHSCAPNCCFDFTKTNQPVLVALRDIKKGEELSFDYNTTDYDLNDPRCACSFRCCCHAPNCLGEIQGYKYLTLEQKSELAPFLAPYLRKYEELSELP